MACFSNSGAARPFNLGPGRNPHEWKALSPFRRLVVVAQLQQRPNLWESQHAPRQGTQRTAFAAFSRARFSGGGFRQRSLIKAKLRRQFWLKILIFIPTAHLVYPWQGVHWEPQNSLPEKARSASKVRTFIAGGIACFLPSSERNICSTSRFPRSFVPPYFDDSGSLDRNLQSAYAEFP